MNLILNFWSECFYLLYTRSFSSVVAESSADFQTMALGNTGLLIYWDPTSKAHAGQVDYVFKYEIFGEHTFKIVSERVESTKSQYKIHSLSDVDTQLNMTVEKNTVTEVGIGQEGYLFTIQRKINSKKDSFPEKPYFRWNFEERGAGPIARITWLPCGEKRNCRGNEAGTHFAVKYKVLDYRESITVAEHFKDYIDISLIHVGKVYEVVVISINGDFETESDSQEIFYTPSSGPVHSVKVLTLSDSSLYISWKKPRHSIDDIYRYDVFHNIFQSLNTIYWNHSDTDENESAVSYYDFKREKRIVTNLKTNILYTFLIFPRVNSYGFGYRLDYSIQAIETNRRLAKPDFIFRFVFESDGVCRFRVEWLPCAEILDCGSMNAGSGFKMNFDNGTYTETYVEHEKLTIDINLEVLEKDQTYKMIGMSVDKFNQSSDSVMKTIACHADFIDFGNEISSLDTVNEV